MRERGGKSTSNSMRRTKAVTWCALHPLDSNVPITDIVSVLDEPQQSAPCRKLLES